MLLRILIVIGILFFLNGYIAVHIIHHLPAGNHHAVLVWSIVLIFLALQMVPFIGRFFVPKLKEKNGNAVIAFAMDWLPYLAFGIFSCLFIYSLLADVIGLAWQSLAMPEDLEKFNTEMLMVLAIFTLSTIIIGVKQAIGGPKVIKVNLPIKNLPSSFDGFKIVQISDLHAGSTITLDYIQNVIRMTNALSPDLVVLTGDIVEGTVNDLKEDVRHLSELQAPYGKYIITGNHEYYWDAAGWINEFRQIGLHPLLNEHVTIKHHQAEIILAGVNDYSTLHMNSEHASSPEKALSNTPVDTIKILLAHQPATYPLAQQAGADVMLSGHTHGGQYFPFNLFIRFFQKHYQGLSKYKNMLIYVNRGTGYWGPPLRTFVPAEITLHTLRTDK